MTSSLHPDGTCFVVSTCEYVMQDRVGVDPSSDFTGGFAMEPYRPLGELIGVALAVALAWLLFFGLPLGLLWLIGVDGALAWALAAIPIVTAFLLLLWRVRDRSAPR